MGELLSGVFRRAATIRPVSPKVSPMARGGEATQLAIINPFFCGLSQPFPDGGRCRYLKPLVIRSAGPGGDKFIGHEPVGGPGFPMRQRRSGAHHDEGCPLFGARARSAVPFYIHPGGGCPAEFMAGMRP
ncbi:MAG: hypothetical protein CM15mP125_2860 [Gammaproteobacteria bacterium]|nr:MAG: hypothetical protein CM15mP125_2860 [Gammaproteobacteria bacterium]